MRCSSAYLGHLFEGLADVDSHLTGSESTLLVTKETLPLHQVTSPLHKGDQSLHRECEIRQERAHQVDRIAVERKLWHRWPWETRLISHQSVADDSKLEHVLVGQADHITVRTCAR